MSTFALAILILGTLSQEKKMPDEGVKVEITEVSPKDPLEGDVMEISYKVTNDTKQVVVIGSGTSRYGSLSTKGDHLVHDELGQQATRPVFYESTQILLPGESGSFVLKRQALDEKPSVQVAFASHDAAKMAIYVLHLLEGMEPRFRGYEKMETAAFGALRKGGRKGRIGGIVILEDGSKGEARASRDMIFKVRKFSLDEAKKLFGEKASEARWSVTLNTWVLASATRTAQVTSKEMAFLPQGSLDVIADLDGGRKEITFRIAKPDESALAKTFKVREGDGMYTRGAFIDVPSEKVMEALGIALKEKLTVKKVHYFFDSYYFEFSP